MSIPRFMTKPMGRPILPPGAIVTRQAVVDSEMTADDKGYRAIAFKFDPEVEERILSERGEIRRLFALPDRELGEALLNLARDARADQRDLMARHGEHEGNVYDTTTFWHLVPEIAKRLGAEVTPPEATNPDINSCDGPSLRQCAYHMYANTLSRTSEGKRTFALNVLLNDAANGNPIAFALDRICPPTDDPEDRFATYSREINGNRGLGPVPYWSPALQDAATRPIGPKTRVIDLTTPEPPELDVAKLAALLTDSEAEDWEVPTVIRQDQPVTLWERDKVNAEVVGLSIMAYNRKNFADLKIKERAGEFEVRFKMSNHGDYQDLTLGAVADIAASPDFAEAVPGATAAPRFGR